MNSKAVANHMMDEHTNLMHADLYVILQFLQEHFLVFLIYVDFLAVIDEVIVFVSWKLLGLLFTLGERKRVEVAKSVYLNLTFSLLSNEKKRWCHCHTFRFSSAHILIC